MVEKIVQYWSVAENQWINSIIIDNSSSPPDGAAGGALAGTYPNPTLSGTAGITTTGTVSVGSLTCTAFHDSTLTTLGLAHVSVTGHFTSSLVVLADLSPTINIPYANVNLTGDVVNSDINAAAAISGGKINPNFGSQTLTSGHITCAGLTDNLLATGIVHSGSGGAFTSSLIVNGDVSPTANINYTTLNLTGAVVNADIAATAAIVYSKLSLANHVVDADINSAAAITVTKIATGTAGQVLMANAAPHNVWTTVSGDITISATGVTSVNSISGFNPLHNITLSSLKTTAYTVLPTDYCVLIGALAASFVISLPATNTVGDTYRFADARGSVSATKIVSITPQSGTINGTTTLQLTTAYSHMTVCYTSANVWIAI